MSGTPLRTPRRNPALANHLSTPLFVPPSPQLKQLGYGTGVHVYRIERSLQMPAKIRSPWVVKRVRGRLSDAVQSKEIAERLSYEADILRQLDHPNIVGFRGSKVMENKQLALAMEHCDTSLGQVIETRLEEDSGPLESKHILKMSFDICKALDYLHTEAHILHGDMKSFNILIKGDFDLCKLCDFGVSQPLNAYGYLDVANKPDAIYSGTDIWSAPEVFVSKSKDISSKADLFSFGLVLYECIALQAPHTDNLVDEDEEYVPEPLTAVNLEKINMKLFDESKDSEGYSMIVNTTDIENRSPNVRNVNDDSYITVDSEVSVIKGDVDGNVICNQSKLSGANNLSHLSGASDGSYVSGLDSTGPDDGGNDDMLEPYLGTRPLMPSQYDLPDDYNPIMEMFFLCTNELAEDRPSAGYLAQFLATVVE